VTRCKELAKPRAGILNRRENVFHRAFDLVPDPFEALEILIDLGFNRILTSGGAPTALEGADMIKELIDKADSRIEIIPGGGVRSTNVKSILETGCASVHLAPYRETEDPTGWGSHRVVDSEEVARVVKACA
jgi:copper homeostasis protein